MGIAVTWLSVIVPTYNGAAYLPAALESIVAQADPDIEVIAVDDGSTDETPAILDSFANRLRLTVIRRRVGNWVANTNLGLERAHGEWACFLHQDDLWRPGRLPAIRPALADRPSLVLHAADFVDPAGRPVGRWSCPLPRTSAPASTVARLLGPNLVPVPA